MCFSQEHYMPIVLSHGVHKLLLKPRLPNIFYIPLYSIDGSGVRKLGGRKLDRLVGCGGGSRVTILAGETMPHELLSYGAYYVYY